MFFGPHRESKSKHFAHKLKLIDQRLPIHEFNSLKNVPTNPINQTQQKVSKDRAAKPTMCRRKSELQTRIWWQSNQKQKFSKMPRKFRSLVSFQMIFLIISFQMIWSSGSGGFQFCFPLKSSRACLGYDLQWEYTICILHGWLAVLNVFSFALL